MYIINGSQVRAARGLLNWSQDDLAHRAIVGRGTIQLLENDTAVREDNIKKIHRTLVDHGIEFHESYGVSLAPKSFKGFSGPESCEQYLGHVLKTIQERGGDFVCLIRNQEMLTKISGRDHRTNLQRLEDVQKITNVKCLITYKTKPSFPTPSFEMRMLPEEPLMLPEDASAFAFGNAWVLGYADDGQQHFCFLAIPQASFMHSCQNYFLPRWHVAKPVFEKKPRT
jgi:transcriptional regulator with XRE-family HTH domain